MTRPTGEQVARARFADLVLALYERGPAGLSTDLHRYSEPAIREILIGAVLWADDACAQHRELRQQMLQQRAVRDLERRRRRLSVVPDCPRDASA